jgi:hypothetical protein
MVTVANVVEKYVHDKPVVYEAMEQGIVSFSNLAEQLLPEIKHELKKEIKLSAVVMALRRTAEKIKDKHKKPKGFDLSSEILMKTGLCDISVVKSPSFFTKVKKMNEQVDYTRGDVLNIIHGTYELSIVTNMKYKKNMLNLLEGEQIINIEENLVALSLSFSKDFMYTPGIIFNASRCLSWEGVNIFELVSTLTELTFIVPENDSIKGYKALRKMVG